MIYELNIPQLNNIKKLTDFLNKNKIKMKIIDYKPGYILIEFNGNIDDITEVFMKNNLLIENINPIKQNQIKDIKFITLKIDYINKNIYDFIKILKSTNGINDVFLFKPLNIIIIIFDNNFLNKKDILKIFDKNNILKENIDINIESSIKNSFFKILLYIGISLICLIADFIIKMPIISVIVSIFIIAYEYKNYLNIFSFIKQYKLKKNNLLYIIFLFQVIIFFIFPDEYKPSVSISIFTLFNILSFINFKTISNIFKLDFLLNYLNEQIKSSKTIDINDIIEINAGEFIHYDGEIIEGNTDIDISIFSDKNQIINRKKGDKVFAGEKVITNPIKIKVTSKNYDSLIMNLFNFYSKKFHINDNKFIFNKNSILILIFIAITVIHFFIFNNHITHLIYKYMLLFGLFSLDFDSIKDIYELLHLKRIFSYGIIIKNFKKYSILPNMKKIIISDELLINKSNITIKYNIFEKDKQQDFINIIYSFAKISNDFISKNIVQNIQEQNIKKLTIKDFHSIDDFNKYGKITINNIDKKILLGEPKWIQQTTKIKLNNIPETTNIITIALVVDSTYYGYLQISIQQNNEILNTLAKLKNKLDIIILTNLKNMFNNFKTLSYSKLNSITNSILVCYNTYKRYHEYNTSSNTLISFIKVESAKFKTSDILFVTKRFYRLFEVIAYKKFIDKNYTQIIKFINYIVFLFIISLFFNIKITLIIILAILVTTYYIIKSFLKKQKNISLKELLNEYIH